MTKYPKQDRITCKEAAEMQKKARDSYKAKKRREFLRKLFSSGNEDSGGNSGDTVIVHCFLQFESI